MSRGRLIVSGYDVLETQGIDGRAETCRARESATSDLVDLHRLPETSDLGLVRPLVEQLAGVQEKHLVRVRRVVQSDGELVVVTDAATSLRLADLLERRGKLRPAEVSALAVGLARAIAALHQEGIAAGEVTPQFVRLDEVGRPMLAGAGFERLRGCPALAPAPFRDPARGESGFGSSESDVYEVAAVCLAALAGGDMSTLPAAHRLPETARDLAGVLLRALAGDPANRPRASALVTRLLTACPSEPIQTGATRPAAVVEGQPAFAPRAPIPPPIRRPLRLPETERTEPEIRRRRTRRVAPAPRRAGRTRPARGPRAVMIAGLVALIGLGVVAGIRLVLPESSVSPPLGAEGEVSAVSNRPVQGEPPRSGPAAEQPASPGPAANRDDGAAERRQAKRLPDNVVWRQTLTALDVRRARAYAASDEIALAEVYAPNSPAARRDVAALRQLTDAGLRAQGMQQRVEAVRMQSVSANVVTLRVRDRLAAVRVVDATGGVRETRPARGPASWTLQLRRGVDASWRVYDVRGHPGVARDRQ